MYVFEFVPYKLIGFVVFWVLVLSASFLALSYARLRLISLLERVRETLWAGRNPREGEKPDGLKLVAAFYLHVLICVIKFRSPIAWLWRTYRKNYVTNSD